MKLKFALCVSLILLATVNAGDWKPHDDEHHHRDGESASCKDGESYSDGEWYCSEYSDDGEWCDSSYDSSEDGECLEWYSDDGESCEHSYDGEHHHHHDGEHPHHHDGEHPHHHDGEHPHHHDGESDGEHCHKCDGESDGEHHYPPHHDGETDGETDGEHHYPPHHSEDGEVCKEGCDDVDYTEPEKDDHDYIDIYDLLDNCKDEKCSKNRKHKNYIDYVHDKDCYQLGDVCLCKDDMIKCGNQLTKLDARGDFIDNHCDVDHKKVDGKEEIIYNFKINYNDHIDFGKDSCLKQKVYFSGVELKEGDGKYDQYHYNDEENCLQFAIRHKDLVKYGCRQITNWDEYEWQCIIDLKILAGGIEQIEYAFLSKSILSRIQENELHVTVQKNFIIGDCCENVLKVDTCLRFCKDFNCKKYLHDGQIVERQKSFYVEHSILQAEFQFYYLNYVSLLVGGFCPNIIRMDNSVPGKIKFEIQSNIAAPGLVIDVISQIGETAYSNRRVLETQEAIDYDEGTDYKVKADQKVDIVDNSEQQYKESAKNDKDDDKEKVITIVFATLGSILGLGLIVGAIIYKLRQKKNKDSAQKAYNEADNSDANSNKMMKRQGSEVVFAVDN